MTTKSNEPKLQIKLVARFTSLSEALACARVIRDDLDPFHLVVSTDTEEWTWKRDGSSWRRIG